MPSRLLVIFSAITFLTFSGAASAVASDTVWSGIVIATNSATPEPVPAELRGIEGTLKRLFGYNQFHLIGQARAALRKGNEDWMAQSKYFALHVDSQGASGSGYLLNLQLFQEKKLLLETEAKLTRRPLVIKGPQIGSGQLLLLLVIQ